MQVGKTSGEAPQARKRRHGLRGSFASRVLLATLHRDKAEQPTSHPATPGRTCASRLDHEKSLWQRRLAEKEGLASEAQRAGGMKTTSKYMAALARKTVLYE